MIPDKNPPDYNGTEYAQRVAHWMYEVRSPTSIITFSTTVTSTSTTFCDTNLINGTAAGIPMGWTAPEPTVEEKLELEKLRQKEYQKEVKRKVFGPKRSRWG